LDGASVTERTEPNAEATLAILNGQTLAHASTLRHEPGDVVCAGCGRQPVERKRRLGSYGLSCK